MVPTPRTCHCALTRKSPLMECARWSVAAQALDERLRACDFLPCGDAASVGVHGVFCLDAFVDVCCCNLHAARAGAAL